MASRFGPGGPDFVRATLKSVRANLFAAISDEFNFSSHLWVSAPRNDPLMVPNAVRHADEALRRKVVCALNRREHEAAEWSLMAGWLWFHFIDPEKGKTDE